MIIVCGDPAGSPIYTLFDPAQREKFGCAETNNSPCEAAFTKAATPRNLCGTTAL